MQIQQFRYSHDNLGYLIFSDHRALAVDPGAVMPMIEFARSRNLTITHVTNTHLHHDHTPGNKAMLEKTGAKFIDPGKTEHGQTLSLGPDKVTILVTPGHTLDSVCFAAKDFIVTGDTLFNGTVGNCFSGDLDAFFDSIEILLKFPLKTKIYAGHDYVSQSMAAARNIEKNNPDIDRFLGAHDPNHVVSTLEDELKVNPYIRFNAPEMIRLLKQDNLPSKTKRERFRSIMDAY